MRKIHRYLMRGVLVAWAVATLAACSQPTPSTNTADATAAKELASAADGQQFGSSVTFFQTVRCIHGFSRSFAKEPAKSSRLQTTIAGRW